MAAVLFVEFRTALTASLNRGQQFTKSDLFSLSHQNLNLLCHARTRRKFQRLPSASAQNTQSYLIRCAIYVLLFARFPAKSFRFTCCAVSPMNRLNLPICTLSVAGYLIKIEEFCSFVEQLIVKLINIQQVSFSIGIHQIRRKCQ